MDQETDKNKKMPSAEKLAESLTAPSKKTVKLTATQEQAARGARHMLMKYPDLALSLVKHVHRGRHLKYKDHCFEPIGERPGDQAEPSLSWEDLVNKKPRQLELSKPFPTLAERAFVALALKWYAYVQTNLYNFRSADILALSCLLLAVEWGSEFTNVAQEQMETNRKAAAANNDESWFNQFLWELCQVPFMMVSPPETVAVKKLMANLDHQSSSTRYWMMEVGWIARPWLAPSDAIPILLKNLADTLHFPFEAAGLAAELSATSFEFWNLAQDCKPSDAFFSKQYAKRLKIVKEKGILKMQAPFWELEADCRKVIADAVLGLRLVPPGE